jgi:hypothetical protein
VVINNVSSDWGFIKAGVPQGSIINRLIFKIFINDIVIDIQSTSLYLIIDNPQTTTDILNRDLDKIHTWSTNWLVSFNPQKTETTTISRKNNKPPHPDIFMNDTPIAEVPNHKHLGLNISKDGTHHTNMDLITEKAYRRFNILRRFKFILDRKTLETIYLTYIRPLLEYADVIWDNITYLVDKIEKVPMEAAKIATGGTRLVSLNNVCLETGWNKLKNRREMHKLVYFYKMKNTISSQYLSDLVPDSLSIHSHSTRNSSIIPPIRTRTSLYTNYFLSATIRSWNLLPERINSSTSVNSFKSNLKSNHPQKPPYFYIGKRLGQILHSRLRMHCSPLNQHLCSKNIVDSPLCQCVAIETTEHSVVYCPLYNVHRQLFIEPIFDDHLISYDHYLFGSPEFRYEQNVEIFLAVQSFIINSKRFNRN